MEELKKFRTLECTYKKAPEIFWASYDKLRSEKMKKVFKQIYEPSDDTFLLIDALYSDLEQLVSRKPFKCLEIGPGSGVVSLRIFLTFIGHIFPCFIAEKEL